MSPHYVPGYRRPRAKPFQARVQFCGVRTTLGYYATYEEAEDVEQRYIDDLYRLALSQESA